MEEMEAMEPVEPVEFIELVEAIKIIEPVRSIEIDYDEIADTIKTTREDFEESMYSLNYYLSFFRKADPKTFENNTYIAIESAKKELNRIKQFMIDYYEEYKDYIDEDSDDFRKLEQYVKYCF
jgi:hypothetical protein